MASGAAEVPGADQAQLYPNCDASVWLRSCEEEVTEPLDGVVTGKVPSWLHGTLLRNGPGSLKVGSTQFRHLFDSSALLHRFAICGGHVTYQCRFLDSLARRRNRAANRIVVGEFGTAATPDPCKTIYNRVSSLFHPDKSISDNAMISVYPFGDEIYAFTEGPVIHRIDPTTLDTCDQKSMLTCAALVNHTSHPHVMPNGDVFNVGMTVKNGRIRHVVVKFPYAEKGDMFASAKIVGSMTPRWPLHPAYMHTFGVTENYFVLVEQPLTVSILGMARSQLSAKPQPLAAALRWFSEQETHVVLISRQDGREKKRFVTCPLFFLHIINAFEDGGSLVVDLCSYKDPQVINAMYVEAIQSMQSNAEYAEWFRSRPVRLRIALSNASLSRVQPVALCARGCETPTIHYALHSGRPYRYFYAISSDVDAENPGTLIKVDILTGEVKTWCERSCYPSEPIFVPSPNAQSEDDGILLSALVWGGERSNAVGLLVLSARDLRELARTEFKTPSPAPKCLHGWFLPLRV